MRPDFPVFVFVLFENSVASTYFSLNMRCYGAEKTKLHKKMGVQAFCFSYHVMMELAFGVFRTSKCCLSTTYDEVNSSLKQMKTLRNQ